MTIYIKKITTLIIGKTTEWKQDASMGRKNNQNFVQIPHSRFIEMIIYKCEKVGLQEEISSAWKKYASMITGSYNIMRKAVPSVLNHGIEGFVVNPIVVEL